MIFTRFMMALSAVAVSVAVSAAAPVTVSQQGLQFSVADLELAKGQLVIFKNDDRTAHNITVSGEGVNLNGGLQQPGVEFKVPFVKAGSYQVSCGIHPKMKLSVTVK